VKIEVWRGKVSNTWYARRSSRFCGGGRRRSCDKTRRYRALWLTVRDVADDRNEIRVGVASSHADEKREEVPRPTSHNVTRTIASPPPVSGTVGPRERNVHGTNPRYGRRDTTQRRKSDIHGEDLHENQRIRREVSEKKDLFRHDDDLPARSFFLFFCVNNHTALKRTKTDDIKDNSRTELQISRAAACSRSENTVGGGETRTSQTGERFDTSQHNTWTTEPVDLEKRNSGTSRTALYGGFSLPPQIGMRYVRLDDYIWFYVFF